MPTAPGLEQRKAPRGREDLAAKNATLGRAVSELASENAELYERLDSLEVQLKQKDARFDAWAKEMA